MYAASSPINDAPTMSEHLPVMLQECLDALQAQAGGRFLDATFGGGGHARALLEASPETELVALDRDPAARARAEALETDFPGRITFISANFSEIGALELGSFEGALFDLGVSSFQLNEAARGFSFSKDAPADMRMNPEEGRSAAQFLETASRDELVRAIRDYGEERSWKRVVDAILEARGSGVLTQTSSLADVIAQAMPPAWKRRSKLHPATLSFQGIRMAVNEELAAIEAALPAAFAALKPGGRLAVISFHSLEDRIVKRHFREWAGRPVDRFDNRPQQSREPVATLLSSKPLAPTETERQANPRSRSARLRALRKW